MLSFHNDPSIKEKYLARVRHNKEMDNIIKGTGWKNGKGGAVGCTLETYDLARYPLELGIPEWLAYLEDVIFDGLPYDKAKDWPELFLASIPVGVDLEKVKHKIAIRRLDNLIGIQTQIDVRTSQLEELINPQITDSITLTISVEDVKSVAPYLYDDECRQILNIIKREHKLTLTDIIVPATIIWEDYQ